MKIIITLLLTFLFVSNVYADDKYKSIADVCKDAEEGVIFYSNEEIKLGERYKDKHDEKSEKYNKEWDDIYVGLMRFVKEYHYLDCREELGR